ncbi:MAG: PEP-CTERM sorting domain-containing protein [Nitrospirae bacterium]|nr:PEP-CTERM sorting domain-containing protein [Nitrospirota bacterium]
MKKFLAVMVAVMFVLTAATAYASVVSIYYDIPGIGQTSVFDQQVATNIDATSTYNNGFGVGASYNDVGDFVIGAFKNGATTLGSIATAGLNDTWELTGRWTDLAGFVDGMSSNIDSTTYTFTYTSGTAGLYADTAMNSDFGAGIGSTDDAGATFNDGTLLASLELLSGNGSLTIPNSGALTGSIFLTWKIIDVPSNVWFDLDGNDMEGLLEEHGVVFVNTLQSVGIQINPTVPTTIDSRTIATVEYGVPEPSTIILLGAGLFGLGLYARKRMS